MQLKSLLIFIALISILFVITDDAQSQIRGIISDAESARPVRDASIVVISTNVGTSTSRTGSFTLQWYSFPVQLRISAIGYETVDITLFDSYNRLSVELIPKVYVSDEVMVSHERIDITNVRTRPIPITVLENDGTGINTSSVDLLRSEKGVYVQQTTPGQGSVYVRGRAGRDVLYLYNGLRINPSFVRSGQNQYFGAIDPLSTKQVSVYRGPVSVYYGSDALSGGVNISPTILPFRDENKLSGKVLTQFNSGGTGEKTLHSQVGYQSRLVTLFLSGTFRDYEYYRMSKDSRSDQWFPYDTHIDVAGHQFFGFQGSARVRINAENQIELVSSTGVVPKAARLDQMIMGYSRQSDPTSDSPTLAYSSNTYPLELTTHSLRYKGIVTNSWVKSLNAVAGFHHLKDHRKEIPFLVQPSFSSGNTTFTESNMPSFDKNTSNQYLLSFDASATPGKLSILRVGGDVSFDVIESRRYNSGNTFGLRNHVDRMPRYPDGSTYLQSGIFTHLTYNFRPTMWVETGLRYSYILADLNLEGTDSERGFDAYSTDFKFTTGSLGLSWSPTRHLYLTSNLSTGFRAPNIADLTELGERRSRFLQVPNQSLAPEKTINTDLSIRWINDILNVELTGYAVNYYDKIESVQTGRIVQVSDGSGTRNLIEVTNRNEDRMRLYGIESSLDYKSGGFNSGFVLNYTYGELILKNGDTVPVDRIPPLNGNIYSGYAFDNGLKLISRIRYALRQDRISSLELQDHRISNSGTAGFWMLQFVASWRIGDHSDLKLVADNITDRSYREHGSSLDGLGRNFTFSYSYLF
jgi:outer membrane receptor protein involved in Fe transport